MVFIFQATLNHLITDKSSGLRVQLQVKKTKFISYHIKQLIMVTGSLVEFKLDKKRFG